jgi:hypothetical protein
MTITHIEIRLGRSSTNENPFFARRDGFLIGTSNTLEEAMESLEWKTLIHRNDKGLR